MQTIFEQAVEIVNSLPSSDLQKLSEIIRKKQSQQSGKSSRKSDVEEEVKKFNLAREWIEKHRQEYLGQWVCLNGGKLISHGDDALEVHREAKIKGIKAPFLEHIVEEPEHYIGGWEACR